MQTWRITNGEACERNAHLSFMVLVCTLLTFLELTYSLNGNLLEIVVAEQKRPSIAGKEQLKC